VTSGHRRGEELLRGGWSWRGTVLGSLERVGVGERSLDQRMMPMEESARGQNLGGGGEKVWGLDAHCVAGKKLCLPQTRLSVKDWNAFFS